jgi:hypothetical protein
LDVSWSRWLSVALLFAPRDDVVDAQQQNRGLDCRLVRLQFDSQRLPQPVSPLLHDLAALPVDPPGAGLALVGVIRVFGPQSRQRPYSVGPAVLRDGFGDDLQGVRQRAVGPVRGLEQQLLGHGHLDGAPARDQPRQQHYVPGDLQRVLQVAFGLVEDVLAGAAQQDRARFWVFAFGDVAEVLVAQLFDLEEAGARAHVGLLQLFGAVGDGGAASARHAVVVGLAQAAHGTDSRLEQEVLGQVGDALFGEDHVGLEGDQVVALAADVLFFELQQSSEIGFRRDFDVRLRFALLVLQRAVQEDDSGVLETIVSQVTTSAPPRRLHLNVPSHLGVGDVLVHHHSSQNLRFFH